MNKDKKTKIVKKENVLKQKVGDGGVKAENIVKAQGAIDNNTVDFYPLAGNLINDLGTVIDIAKESNDENVMGEIIHPILQLKAQGVMFNYPVYTDVSSDILQFLEDSKAVDDDILKIVLSFYQSLKIIHNLEIKDSSHKAVEKLNIELNSVYARYLAKKKAGK